MSTLTKIISHKELEVAKSKEMKPISVLEQSNFFEAQPIPMTTYLKRDDRVGIIAEIKRSSPSTGIINNTIDVEQLSMSYIQSGASSLSILTDTVFFGGSNRDLEIARKFNSCPILRKDFIIDEYQIIESKSIGADVILLIAACLTPEKCKALALFAKQLHLEVLLEVRTKEEIDTHTNEYIDLIGVNNRNLNDFTTDITNSLSLIEHLPKSLIKISESGITEASQILELANAGYDGFLIGGYFMKHEEPGRSCKSLINNFNTLSK